MKYMVIKNGTNTTRILIIPEWWSEHGKILLEFLFKKIIILAVNKSDGLNFRITVMVINRAMARGRQCEASNVNSIISSALSILMDYY